VPFWCRHVMGRGVVVVSVSCGGAMMCVFLWCDACHLLGWVLLSLVLR
jgi:hypothetical protein